MNFLQHFFHSRWAILPAALWILGICATDSFYRVHNLSRATHFSTSEISGFQRDSIHGHPIRQVILPPSSVDSRWWIIHTDKLGGSFRVRETPLDNAPHGREVHWSSPIIWLLATLKSITGASSAQYVSLFCGPILLILGLTVLLVAFVRTLLPPATIFLLLGLGTNILILQAFSSGETDHHGIAALMGAGCVLGLALAGFSRKSDEPFRAKYSFWLIDISAFFGAMGLWLSASTTLPVLLAIGAAGFSAITLQRLLTNPAPFYNPWRRWGRVGALVSLVCYLIEYFPSHLGIRLEVIHPAYSLAWWAGTEMLHQWQSLPQGNVFQWIRHHRWRLAGLFLATSLPLLLIWVFPQSFLIRDPFLSRLHTTFIVEFQGLLPSLSKFGSLWAYFEVFLWPVSVAVLGLLIARANKISLWNSPAAIIGLFPAGLFSIMTLFQQRWLVSAGALWVVVLTLIVQGIFRYHLRVGAISKVILFSIAGLSFVYLPFTRLQSEQYLSQTGGVIPKEWLQMILLRDVAHRLVDSMHGLSPTILSDPTSSTDLAFFGNLHVIGTLYWENLEGLRASAEMFSEMNPERLKELLEQRRVTHLVIPTWETFGVTSPGLIGKPDQEFHGFLSMVCSGDSTPPDWLRPLFYPIPDSMSLKDEKIAIFQFLPNQSHGEALYHRAVFAMELGDTKTAYELVDQILKTDPAFPDADRLKNEIILQFRSSLRVK